MRALDVAIALGRLASLGVSVESGSTTPVLADAAILFRNNLVRDPLAGDLCGIGAGEDGTESGVRVGNYLRHAPSISIAQAHFPYKPLVLLSGKSLGQDVGRLVVSGQVVEDDVARFNLMSQEVITDVDVFGTVVELWVLGGGDGGLVVDEEWNGEGRWLL